MLQIKLRMAATAKKGAKKADAPAKPKKATKPKSPKKAAKKAGAKKGKPVFLHIKKLIDFKGMHYVFSLALSEYFICRRFPYQNQSSFKKK